MSAFVSGVISPESLHCIAEMHHDILAVERLIVDQFSAGLAEEHLVLDLAFGATPFDDEAERLGRAAWRVGDVWRNEKRLAFLDEVVDDAAVLPRLDDDVTRQLDEELLAIDFMEVVPRVWAADHHGEEITAAVEILVAHRWLEVGTVGFGPVHQMLRATDRAILVEPIWFERGERVRGGTVRLVWGRGHGGFSGASDGQRGLITLGHLGCRHSLPV